MPNGLRTDYILLPAQSFDPMRPTRNRLEISGAENQLRNQQLQNEALTQENMLRGQKIKRGPINDEVEALKVLSDARQLATPETWPAYRQILTDAGLRSEAIPTKFDPAWVSQADDEISKMEADIKRADTKAAAEIERKNKAASAAETRAQKKFEAEQRRAKEKFDREQEQAKDKKTGDAAEKQANSARQFIQSLSKQQGDTFSVLLASFATGGKVDPSLVDQGKNEIPKELMPAYNQAIKVLEKYYGVPAEQSSFQELTYTPGKGLTPSANR